MANEVQAETGVPALFDYTAFEKWEYQQIIYRQEFEQVWIDFSASFYQASRVLVEGEEQNTFFPDIEGVAAIFLFRHYLELALKRIVVRGRCLIRPDVNAAREDVREVARIHSLRELWELVLVDAKTKMVVADWGGYDIEFLVRCITEFHEADERGFAFRYPKQGGERLRYDFGAFRRAMKHVQQILDGITAYLVEQHAQNAEWDVILREQAGF